MFVSPSLLKSVIRGLDASTVWMNLCSLVQHITEELSLSLALPLEIFQACEMRSQVNHSARTLRSMKSTEMQSKRCSLEELPRELKGYGYNATHAKHASCSLSHKQTVPTHNVLNHIKSSLNLIELQIQYFIC